MNRREMFMLPAVALVAQQGFAQAAQVSQSSSERPAQHVSHKVLLKYSRPKAISKVPKTQTKTTKYLNSLNTLLGLTPSQQQQATTMFTAAVTARAAIRSNMKAARQGLTTAIMNNDSAGINQASMAIGRPDSPVDRRRRFCQRRVLPDSHNRSKNRLSMTEFKG